MNTHETMQASDSTTPIYRLKSLLDFQQVPYDRLDECLVNLGTWLRAARIAGTATEVRDARGGLSGFNLETGELVWADDGVISASTAAVAVQTWRARIAVGPDFPLHAPTNVERAMEAEIEELRSALRRPSTGIAAAAVDRLLKELCLLANDHEGQVLGTSLWAIEVITGLLSGLDAEQLA